MLIMNRPAVPTSLFIEFSDQAHFTGWSWRVIYMQTADTVLRRVNQLSCTMEAMLWQHSKKKHGWGREKNDLTDKGENEEQKQNALGKGVPSITENVSSANQK